MAISSSDIVIFPAAAAAAGCSATATVVDYEDQTDIHSGWRMEYSFLARPAEGWEFVRWDFSLNSSYSNVPASTWTTANPVERRSGGSWYLYEERAYSWNYQYPYQIDAYNYITSLRAVFRRLPTNLILRSAANGQILHGAGDTILHDA